MSLLRPTAWLVTVAVIGAVAGCSSDGEPAAGGGDADAAHTTACRTYLLGVAGQDERATTLLTGAAHARSWNNDLINASLDAVREATRDAGLVEGLSDDDFEVYGALAEATGTAYDRTNPDGGEGITMETAVDFRTAADAVRDDCDSG